MELPRKVGGAHSSSYVTPVCVHFHCSNHSQETRCDRGGALSLSLSLSLSRGGPMYLYLRCQMRQKRLGSKLHIEKPARRSLSFTQATACACMRHASGEAPGQEAAGRFVEECGHPLLGATGSRERVAEHSLVWREGEGSAKAHIVKL